MEINYRKNKNSELFQQMQDNNFLGLENIQNYIPIYERFFNLNEKNYNSINLNNFFKLDSLKKKIDYSKFIGNIIDVCNNNIEKKIFFKYSPMVDPVKYMIGKFDTSYNIFELPNFINRNDKKIINKYYDVHNSAYSDGFFSYLSSLLLNNNGFLNGIDYYGSFLGIKKDFVVEISDDLEYLDDSDFFHKNNTILFKINENENYKKLFSNTKKNKRKLKILDVSNNSENIDIELDDIDLTIEILNLTSEESNIEIKSLDLCEEFLEDYENKNTNTISNENTISDENTISNENKKQKKNKTNEMSSSSSNCSSRYSITEDDTSNNEDDDEDDEDDEDEEDDEDDESSEDEELFATINKFPVQTIALECCDDTLDSYIVNDNIKDQEYESIVLQILFTLITYQKVFDFKHNDLHTNNIV